MEKEKYTEEGEYYLETNTKNETQILLEKIFSKDYYFEGYEIVYNTHKIDFQQELYENFEIYKPNDSSRICFGFWDDTDAMIRWFIDKDEVDLVKNKLKPKN